MNVKDVEEDGDAGAATGFRGNADDLAVGGGEGKRAGGKGAFGVRGRTSAEAGDEEKGDGEGGAKVAEMKIPAAVKARK